MGVKNSIITAKIVATSYQIYRHMSLESYCEARLRRVYWICVVTNGATKALRDTETHRTLHDTEFEIIFCRVTFYLLNSTVSPKRFVQYSDCNESLPKFNYRKSRSRFDRITVPVEPSGTTDNLDNLSCLKISLHSTFAKKCSYLVHLYTKYVSFLSVVFSFGKSCLVVFCEKVGVMWMS